MLLKNSKLLYGIHLNLFHYVHIRIYMKQYLQTAVGMLQWK